MDAICENQLLCNVHLIQHGQNTAASFYFCSLWNVSRIGGFTVDIWQICLMRCCTLSKLHIQSQSRQVQTIHQFIHACRRDPEHRSLGAFELQVNGGVCERSQLGWRRDISHGVSLAYGICADRPGVLDLQTLGEAF